jgi:hypothetical protein
MSCQSIDGSAKLILTAYIFPLPSVPIHVVLSRNSDCFIAASIYNGSTIQSGTIRRPPRFAI